MEITIEDRVVHALTIAFEDGQTDGAHHKMWVIDQMVQALTGENYDKWISRYCTDDKGETYTWDTGICP